MSEENHQLDEHDRPRIKVTDRRLFDRDGNPRDPEGDAEVSTPPAAESGPVAAPAPPPETAPPPLVTSAAAGEAASPAAPQGTSAKPISVPTETLLQYVEEQYMMGMIALGAMPHPQTGEPAEDLDMAHLRIEMLESVDERTRPQRDPQASQALEEVLYRMRMAYLQKRKVVKL